MEQRSRELQEGNVKLLKELCGPGDFLPGWVRTAVVQEALAATFTCQGCRALQQQKLNDSWQAMHAVQHSFHEPGDCHGLGVVVHGLANAQQMLTEAWYRKALDLVCRTLRDAGEEVPDTEPDRLFRFTELIACVALAVGHLSFYRCLGGILKRPTVAGVAGPPRFSAASQVTRQLAAADPDNYGWGPNLAAENVVEGFTLTSGEAFSQFFSSMALKPSVPLSKWTPALSTGAAFLDFGTMCYTPMTKGSVPPNYMFKKAPGRWLNRAQIEIVAADYSASVECSY